MMRGKVKQDKGNLILLKLRHTGASKKYKPGTYTPFYLFVYFSFFFAFFCLLWEKMLKCQEDEFNHQMPSKAPVLWLKYTT